MQELNRTEHLTQQKTFHFNHSVISKLDKFILEMPKNKWFKIEGSDHETKVAVIKDWIEKDILQPGYLVLSEDYKSFIKRSI